MLYKGTTFEAKDINKGKRIAIIKYATYGSLDRDNDMSCKGMFTRSWNNSPEDIRFFLNHTKELTPGRPQGFDDGRSAFWEDDGGAYARLYLGTHTLGEDTLKMMDEGIITNNSFGFDPVKSMPIKDKGKSFKEVKLWEVSVLTHWGAHPDSKVMTVDKAVKKEELTEEISAEIVQLRKHINAMKSFCHNTTASDFTIINILEEIESAEEILKSYDTVSTQSDDDQIDPAISVNKEKEAADALLLLTLKFN